MSKDIDEIKRMPAGDLVHFMLSNYSKAEFDNNEPYMQSGEYFIACQRLNELMPVDDLEEVTQLAMNAADEAKHG